MSSKCHWRKLHNEKLRNLYSSPYTIRMIKSKSRRMGLAGKEKIPLGKAISRWVDNINMDLREIGWGGMDSIDLAQDRDQWRALANTAVNLRVP
jgi:hypothetical protein